MDPNALIRLALSLEQAVLEVVPLGGHWEIWYQTELARLLRRSGVGVRLEAGYGVGSLQRMDILMVVGRRQVTVELKVESATTPTTFAGESFTDAVGGDLFKSRQYRAQAGRVLHRDRWALAVAYSGAAIQQMAALFGDTPPSYFGVGPGLSGPGQLLAHELPDAPAAYFAQRSGIAAAVYVSENY